MNTSAKQLLVVALSLFFAVPLKAQPEQLTHLDSVQEMITGSCMVTAALLRIPQISKQYAMHYSLSREDVSDAVEYCDQFPRVLAKLRAYPSLSAFWSSANQTVEDLSELIEPAQKSYVALAQIKESQNFISGMDVTTTGSMQNMLPITAEKVMKLSDVTTAKLQNYPEHKLFVDKLNKSAQSLSALAQESLTAWPIIASDPDVIKLVEKARSLQEKTKK